MGFWSFYNCSLSQLTCFGMCHIIYIDAVTTWIRQKGQESLLCITVGCDGKLVQCKMTDCPSDLGKANSF